MTQPSSPAGVEPGSDVDPSFVFAFTEYDDPDADHQRWTTWHDVEPLSRGPKPRPDWVVTSRGAVDTDLHRGPQHEALARRACGQA
jgi:RIO kinase 1